jgi:hypothetical protein
MVFDKQAQWDWRSGGNNGKPGVGDDVFTVEYTPMGPTAPMVDGADEAPTEESPLPAGTGDMEVDDDVDDENLDPDHDDDALLHFHSMSDILTTPRFTPRALVAEELHVVSSNKPASFAEAEHSPSWRKSMMEEMDSIEENGTWGLTDLPPGRKPIGVKWVFKVKRDEHGAVSKHMARLMVKGYAQRHGIDYNKVFVPVARLDLVRLLIALTTHEGWEVHHMDVKSAFFNGDLQEEVYVEQTASFIVTGKEHKVLKLKKALYGLHQVPRAWNMKLDDTLLSLGFWRTPLKHTIYVRQNGNVQLVVGVYVNDLIITGSDRDNIRSFKEEMAAVFKMSDLGLLHYYLSIEMKQSVSGNSLSQGAYMMKILERSDMTGCNPCHIPMETRLKMRKQSTQPLVDATAYRSIVRSLRYLVNTRPDLAFAVGYVSHFLVEPREDHLAAVKKILRYVAGTYN